MTAATETNEKEAKSGRINFAITQKLFLGSEFLTWLYFAALPDLGVSLDLNALCPVKDHELQIGVGRRVVARAVDATGAKVSLQGAGLDASGELLQAVRRGATLDVLALDMAVGSRVYSITVNQDGSITSIKLPDLFTDEEEGKSGEVGGDGSEIKPKRKPKLPAEDVIDLRMACLDEIESVVDALLGEFMRRRMSSDAWARDERAILRCISEGLSARSLERV